jgi:hypothetical protein
MGAEIHILVPRDFHGDPNAARILGILRALRQIRLSHFFPSTKPNHQRHIIHFRFQKSGPILRERYHRPQGLNHHLRVHSTSNSNHHNLHNQLCRVCKCLYRIFGCQHNCLDLLDTLCLDLFHITTAAQGCLRLNLDGFFPWPGKPRHTGRIPPYKLLRAYRRVTKSRHRHPCSGD